MPFITLEATSDVGMGNLGTLFGSLTGWMGQIVTTITSSPLLMLGLGIFVVGAVDKPINCPT